MIKKTIYTEIYGIYNMTFGEKYLAFNLDTKNSKKCWIYHSTRNVLKIKKWLLLHRRWP